MMAPRTSPSPGAAISHPMAEAFTLLTHLEGSHAALDRGDWPQAHQRLVEAALSLAGRARWLQGEAQRRHLALSDRLLRQAQRLGAASACLPGVRADASAPQPSACASPTEAAMAGEGTLALPEPQLSASAGGPSGLADVEGAEAIKQLLQMSFVHPMRHPACAALYRQRVSGGVLLYGPPGTGKTYLVRALAAELGVPVFNIAPSEILSKWLGEAEKQLAALFAKAREHPAALIFIDEIDALAPNRDHLGDSGGPLQRLLTQLLTELDGFGGQRGQLMFMAATNRPWALDDALLRPGRLDAVAYLGLPGQATREGLLRRELQGIPQASDLAWPQVARALRGCSAAETVACARQAARLAFGEAVRSGQPRPVQQADLLQAARTTSRAASAQLHARFVAFAQARGLEAPQDGPEPVDGEP